MIEIPEERARRIVLDVQGLRTPRPCGSVIDVARRIHSIQIDTISVVSRSHDLIVFNRLPSYTEGDVWREQREGRLFEYWSHAMCLLPMESFPFYAWVMEHMRNAVKGWQVEWGVKNRDTIDEVYRHVQKNGPTASSQLGTRDQRSNGWWDWKKEKLALEYLLIIGRLLVAHREGFQKYYDLRDRVLPAGVDSEPIPDDGIPEYVIDTVLRSIGLGDYRDLKTYMGGLPFRQLWSSNRTRVESALMEHCGTLVEEVTVEGQSGRFFIHRDYVDLLDRDRPVTESEPVLFLSPFDNIVRERHYPRSLWQFDYTIESYTPVAKRKHGYYVLPILDGISLAGRADAKVHRDSSLLELKSLYIENDAMKTQEGVERLARGIKRFMQFHRCTDFRLGQVTPRSLRSRYLNAIQ